MGNPKPYDAYSPYGWKCENRGEFHGTIQGVADSGCEGGEGARLIGFVNAPACWDGVHLDSADHRSHVVHRILKNDVGWVCPDTHQHTIPTFSLGIYFDHNGPDDLRTWHLSSDGMTNPQAGGSTLHADWFGAWDDDILETWHNEVILGYRTTAGGGLGDGRGLVASPNFFSHKDGRLIDIPPRPTK